jgi:predicted permease
MLRDVRYALRLLSRNPGFAATAIISMACGIAACTAVFSLVYTVLLRPLPVPRAEEVVSIYGASREKGTLKALSMPDYRDLAAPSDLFDGVGAYFRTPLLVDAGDESERVSVELPTGNYHTMLGLRPALGRLILPEDDRTGAPAVVVLSDAFWRRRFDARPSAIGRQLRINDVPFEIVGVAPASFTGVLLDWYGAPDVWLPLSQFGRFNTRLQKLGILTKRDLPWLQVTARLKPGVTVDAATAALQAKATNLAREYPASNADTTFTAMPTSRARFWPGRRGVVIDFAAVLLGTVAILLLIAVLNVANLLLARLASRQREISIRLAIGADRASLARQLLVEGLVLSGAATLASVPLSFVLTTILARLDLPFFVVNRALDLSPDWRVFGVVATLCAGCGLLLGLAPAWRAWRADVRSGLTGVPSSSPGRTIFGQWDLRHALAAMQIAVCLTLTVGAGLLGKSLLGLMSTDLGYSTDRVTLFELETYMRGYTPDKNLPLYRALLTRVRSLPGVAAAAFAQNVLPSTNRTTRAFTAPAAEDPQARAGLSARYNVVTAGYFETVRMPLVAGRTFEEHDSDAPPSSPSSVAILNEVAARRLWQDPNRAIGQRIRLANEHVDREVIGVVRNAVYDEVDEPAMSYLFLPADPASEGGMTLHVRGPREPGDLIAQVRRELRLLDRSLAFSTIRLADEHVASRLAAPNLAARLSIAASAAGVALAIVGLYAVLAYLVSQRRTELAIRMSIGAAPAHILRFVAGFGLKIVFAGTLLGLAGAAAAMRLIATQLRGVNPFDPLVYAIVITLVLLVALGACLLPARRAARLDPWAILRH